MKIYPYPLLNIQATLSQLAWAKYFKVVDLASGFWKTEMGTLDIDKAAFSAPSGNYQRKRMPMGLVNSPAVWQQTTNVTLAVLLGKLCFLYIGEIIIHSHNFEEHLTAFEGCMSAWRHLVLSSSPQSANFLEVPYLVP